MRKNNVMKKDELEQIPTKQDLFDLEERIQRTFIYYLKKNNPKREFYSPKEFEAITGIPYSTVVYKCKMGKLKAFQDSPNCSWFIHASELDRYVKEAEANVTGAITN